MGDSGALFWSEAGFGALLRTPGGGVADAQRRKYDRLFRNWEIRKNRRESKVHLTRRIFPFPPSRFSFI